MCNDQRPDGLDFERLKLRRLVDMTSTDEPDRAPLTIQQVARLTGLSPSTLRYYEDVGLINQVPRDDSSGHRRYPAALVERIESLAHLRATGLSIEAMRTLMSSGAHSPDLIATKVELLAGHRRQVDAEIEALIARRDFLDNRIAYWTAHLAGDQAGAEELQQRARALYARLG